MEDIKREDSIAETPEVIETPAVGLLTPTVKKKKKKTAAKAKTRDAEELKTVEVKSMSDNEKKIAIEDLRNECRVLEQQVAHYKANSVQAFEKMRAIEEQYSRENFELQSRLSFVKQAASTMYQSINIATK